MTGRRYRTAVQGAAVKRPLGEVTGTAEDTHA